MEQLGKSKGFITERPDYVTAYLQDRLELSFMENCIYHSCASVHYNRALAQIFPKSTPGMEGYIAEAFVQLDKAFIPPYKLYKDVDFIFAAETENIFEFTHT